MAVLSAFTTVKLGPYPKVATLTITSPQTNSISAFPLLNKTTLSLTKLPISVTLAVNTLYTFTAGGQSIDYSASTS